MRQQLLLKNQHYGFVDLKKSLMLQNENVLAKIGGDSAENEPNAAANQHGRGPASGPAIENRSTAGFRKNCAELRDGIGPDGWWRRNGPYMHTVSVKISRTFTDVRKYRLLMS